MKLYKLIPVVLFGFCFNSYSQEEFDKEKFIVGLNNEIKKEVDGVTFKKIDSSLVNDNEYWVNAIAEKPQDFAVIALDKDGTPIDLFE